MTGAVYPGPFAPDNPARRLPWILAISVLLVLLALLGLGRILHPPARQTAKPKPLRARIYELPASRGAAAARPARRHPVGTALHRAQPQTQRPQPHHNRALHTHRPTKLAIPHLRTPKGAALAQPSPARQPTSPPRSQPTRPQRHPAINWATLQSQINSVVRQSDPSLPQIHDPHTLVARNYIASVLLKLQRIGDMNYPTDLTGTPVLRLVIGTRGQLLQLTLLHSSGNDKLDQDALRIARESARFAPFPDQLKRQTQHIEEVIYMNFEGYRQLYAGY